MTIKSSLIAIVSSLAIVIVQGEAFAQGTSDQRSACMGDAFRFCSADIPSVAKIETCLSQNRANLTPACAAEFQPAQSTLLKPDHFRKN